MPRIKLKDLRMGAIYFLPCAMRAYIWWYESKRVKRRKRLWWWYFLEIPRARFTWDEIRDVCRDAFVRTDAYTATVTDFGLIDSIESLHRVVLGVLSLCMVKAGTLKFIVSTAPYIEPVIVMTAKKKRHYWTVDIFGKRTGYRPSKRVFEAVRLLLQARKVSLETLAEVAKRDDLFY